MTTPVTLAQFVETLRTLNPDSSILRPTYSFAHAKLPDPTNEDRALAKSHGISCIEQ